MPPLTKVACKRQLGHCPLGVERSGPSQSGARGAGRAILEVLFMKPAPLHIHNPAHLCHRHQSTQHSTTTHTDFNTVTFLQAAELQPPLLRRVGKQIKRGQEHCLQGKATVWHDHAMLRTNHTRPEATLGKRVFLSQVPCGRLTGDFERIFYLNLTPSESLRFKMKVLPETYFYILLMK